MPDIQQHLAVSQKVSIDDLDWAAARAAGAPIRAVMLSRLGPNVWHDSLAAAMATLEELEETAKLVHLSPTPPEPLTESQINDLRQTFGARW